VPVDFSWRLFCITGSNGIVNKREQLSFCFTGLPPGVVNFVFGLGPSAGEAIVTHPDVPLISFTGGTVTATKLRVAAAPFSKKMSLEVCSIHQHRKQ